MPCEQERLNQQNAKERRDAAERLVEDTQELCASLEDPLEAQRCVKQDLAAARRELSEAEEALARAEAALKNCEAGLPAAGLRQAEGHLTVLHVRNAGEGFGAFPAQFINANVVFRVYELPGRAFGFQLRNDNQAAARQGMLQLLRDAFVNDYLVRFDYEQELNKVHSIARNIEIRKPPPGIVVVVNP